MEYLHSLQIGDLGNEPKELDPEEYFRTLPPPQGDEFDRLSIDHFLANELFLGDYELSVTCEPSDLSKRDFEDYYFKADLNLLDNKFIQNLDEFQLRHPPKPLSRLRSNTVNLVGFYYPG